MQGNGLVHHAGSRCPVARRSEITDALTTLPPPPANALKGASLFLDLDGTLLDLVDEPDEVRFDPETETLLATLIARLDGRVAIVSGRSLEQIDRILGPCAADLAISASHGSEHRWQGVHAHPARPASLDEVAGLFRRFAAEHPGTLVEDKSFGVALHYRKEPGAEPQALELATSLAQSFELHLQRGKMVVELRVAGGDKGAAVRRLMSRSAMAGTVPIFAGDDLTDEPGFAAVRELDGIAVLVGDKRATAANFRLPSPEHLRRWLAEAAR